MKGLSFSEPMVKAWLAGNKTVTRRLMKNHVAFLDHYGKPLFAWGLSEHLVQYDEDYELWNWMGKGMPLKGDWIWRLQSDVDDTVDVPIKPPYRPGETVYIKETWGVGCRPDHVFGWRDGIEYKADVSFLEENDILDLYPVNPPAGVDISDMKSGWKSPRFMPEWASRSHARIVSVRPERVQEITEEEAIKEGTTPSIVGAHLDYLQYRAGFQTLWESIHKGSWGRNDWVWRIELEKL